MYATIYLHRTELTTIHGSQRYVNRYLRRLERLVGQPCSAVLMQDDELTTSQRQVLNLIADQQEADMRVLMCP